MCYYFLIIFAALSFNNSLGMEDHRGNEIEQLDVLTDWDIWVRSQISQGLDVNAMVTTLPFGIPRKSYGLTPRVLHLAVEYSNLLTVKILIDKGATIDCRALCVAATRGHVELFKLLIEKGNSSTDDYVAALSTAARHGQLGIVQELLNSQVDANKLDSSGMTPLHACVAGSCNIEIIQALLEHGANINKLSDKKRTPLDIARDRKKQYAKRGEQASYLSAAIKELTTRGGQRGKHDNCLIM